MKKKSLISIFLLITMSVLSIIIVFFGLLFLFYSISNSNDLELMISQTETLLEEGVGVTLDSDESIEETMETYAYNIIEEALDEVLLETDQEVKESTIMLLAGREFIDGIFVMNKTGDIIYSELKHFEGNIRDITDDSGKKVVELFSQGLLEVHSLKFSSKWLENGVLSEYLSIVKSVDDKYYIGVYEKKSNTVELYKESILDGLNTIPDSQLLQLIIYDYNGQSIRGHVNLDEDLIKDMIDNTKGEIQRKYYPEEGLLYYKAYPEMEWLVINKSDILNEYVYEYEQVGIKNDKRLCVLIHIMVGVVFAAVAFFLLVYKTMRKKVEHQITSLKYAVKSDHKMLEEDIKYDEFYRVVQIVNQLKPVQATCVEKIKVVKEDYTYVMEELLNQMVKIHLDNPSESFEIQEIIDSSIIGFNEKQTAFSIEATSDSSINLYQNKKLLVGTIRFLVLNILMNTGRGKNNHLSVEFFSDDDQVMVNIMRNTISSKYENDDDLIQELEIYVSKGLSGHLITSKYENTTKELTVQFPIVKELTDNK